MRHDLQLEVEEGRYESLAEDAKGRPIPSRLSYGCFVRIAGSVEPDVWTGANMQVVVSGQHPNGSRITIAGSGSVGFDDEGSIGIEFERPPQILVDAR